MKRSLKVSAVIGFSVVAMACACLSLAQPLLPSSAYIVHATQHNTPIHAELLSPPFVRGAYYVHLPGVEPARYRWFGVAFRRRSVFSPIALYTGWWGIRYVHTDQVKGVRLTSPKIEDEWSVVFTSDGVRFSNASLAVSLARHP